MSPFLPPRPAHVCVRPEIFKFFRHSLSFGTRWQCDDCDQVWVVAGPMTPRQPQKRWHKEIPTTSMPPKPPPPKRVS